MNKLTRPLQADENGPQRRCIVEARSLDPSQMVRFVVGPNSEIVPDIDRVLPGRGMWVQAQPALIERAVREGRFARTARTKVSAGPELGKHVENLLARKLQDMIGLARRAGRIVVGFEKTASALRARNAVMLLAARDAADDGRNKLRRLAPQLEYAGSLTAGEIGHAIGRDHAVHAALLRTSDPGRDGLYARLCLANAQLVLMRGNNDGDLENLDGGCIQASSHPLDAI